VGPDIKDQPSFARPDSRGGGGTSGDARGRKIPIEYYLLASQSKLLRTQPGVGPNTALALVLTIGDVRRFRRGKHVAKLSGIDSARGKFRRKTEAGGISKQGNGMLRLLLVEAAQIAGKVESAV